MLNPEIKKKFLTSKPLQYLDPHEFDMMLHYTQLVSFSPGELLQEQGKISEGMSCIGRKLLWYNGLLLVRYTDSRRCGITKLLMSHVSVSRSNTII